jgi:hypothetical protein
MSEDPKETGSQQCARICGFIGGLNSVAMHDQLCATLEDDGCDCGAANLKQQATAAFEQWEDENGLWPGT